VPGAIPVLKIDIPEGQQDSGLNQSGLFRLLLSFMYFFRALITILLEMLSRRKAMAFQRLDIDVVCSSEKHAP
jgi:hypothetical protein